MGTDAEKLSSERDCEAVRGEVGVGIQSFVEDDSISAAKLWRSVERDEISVVADAGSYIALSDSDQIKLALMLHLSLPVTSEPPFDATSIDTRDRDLQEFARSMSFWRSRHHVDRLKPTLVHAGDDGTLIYRIDVWLVLLNRSDDEIEIDLGNNGSLWLMLATSNLVRLHGSRLILSRYSGAVLGNEHARSGMR